MEFQAVVLAAGRGSRFPEVTGGKPKCLLPIGNLPLIWYPLNLLEKQGFSDALVIVLDSQKSEIQTVLEKTTLKIKLELIGIPSEDFGTAESLRYIREKLINDVLIVPCDIVTEANLNEVFKKFRMHDATISCLLLSGAGDENVVVPGPKNNHKPERDIIGVDKQTDRLVFIASASDFKDTINIPTHLLKKHKSVSFYSKLLDSHIYAIKNWVLDYVVHEKNISTIKGELIPIIVKKQLSNGNKISQDSDMDNKKFIDFFRDVNVMTCNSMFNDANNGSIKYHGDLIRCYVSILSLDCFGLRVNNIASFCAANQKIKEIWPKLNSLLVPTWVSTQSEINSTQIDEKCIVGHRNMLSEKTSFKNCILDTDCTVKPKVRLVNCILMSGVVIEESVILEDCVIGCNVTIGQGTNLKSCLVGHNHIVPPSTIKQKELLVENDRLMEI